MKKLFTTIAIVAAAATASFAQSQNETIVKARNAAKDCIQSADIQTLQVEETAALEPCGNGNFNGTVTFYAITRCPNEPHILCKPLLINIATVTVTCDDTYTVVCY